MKRSSPDESDDDPREDNDDQCENDEWVDTDGDVGLDDGSDGSGVDWSMLPSDDHASPPPSPSAPLTLPLPPPPPIPLLTSPTL